MRKRVLVFPCGSEIGLEINRAISYSKHFELIGASSVESDHGKYVFKNYVTGLPFIDHEGFINSLNSVIGELRIDYIFPAHDSVALKLSEYQQKLACPVIGSPYKTCHVCRSKKRTYHLFKDKLVVPVVYDDVNNIPKFPVFMKPDIGQGSKGIYVATSREETDFYLHRDKTLIPMEYLPGREYTVDCFTDKSGKLLFTGARQRNRISNGISVDTFAVYDKKFEEIAAIINNTLEFRGAWFFQVKERRETEYVLMEIAPRIAGSMGLYRNLGVNLPLLSLYDLEGIDVEVTINNYRLTMDRALCCRFKNDLLYENVYMDLDDTVILDGKFNLPVITFIYQCKNNNIKIHLISRHSGDIKEHLKKFNLENIFDSIIYIGIDQEKYQYITEKNAIFIDDSFSERIKVSKELGIPVFDVNTVESLLDWRI